jgi:hypothetical protein
LPLHSQVQHAFRSEEDSFLPPILMIFSFVSFFCQELIKQPEGIVSSYYYSSCNLFLVHDGIFQCLTQQILRVDVPPFTPSFTYNYLCGSTLLSSYLPIYFYLYLFQILTTPLGSYLLIQCIPYNKLPPSIRSNLPGLLWPNHWATMKGLDFINLEQNKIQKTDSFIHSSSIAEREIPSSSLLFKVNRMANKFMHDVLVLITFGLCCPLLSFAISLSMLLSIFEINVMVGRFILLRASRCNDQEKYRCPVTLSFDSSFLFVETLVHDLAPACRNLVWIVIWSSCFFFMFLCWDIAGDELGLQESSWVPAVIFSTAFIFYFYCLLYPLNTTPQPTEPYSQEGEEVISSLHMKPASPSSPEISSFLGIEMEKKVIT